MHGPAGTDSRTDPHWRDGPWQKAGQRLTAHRPAATGLTVLAALMLAVATGLIAGGGPVGAALAAGHQSLTFALLAGLGGAALGLLWAATAVALGERAERAIMAPAAALTGLPLALALPLAGGLLGPERGLVPMAVVTALIAAPAVAVIARDELRALLRREFLSAAQAAGIPNGRRLRRHILPNAVLPLAAAAWTALPRALMAESLASLLGLGLPEGVTGWGTAIGAAVRAGDAVALAGPALLLALTLWALHGVGDGMRLAFSTAAGGHQ
ncbi:ABC transporter permease subunit [Azospirillum argentinense]